MTYFLIPWILFIGILAVTLLIMKYLEFKRYAPEKRKMVQSSKEYWYEILDILVWLPQDKYRSLDISPEMILKQSKLIKEAELRLKKQKWFDLLEVTQPLNSNTLDIHRRILGWQRYSEAWNRYNQLNN